MKMTRRLIVFVLTAVLMTATQSIAAFGEGTSFKDVSTSHWAHDNIEFMAAKGIVKGYPGGEFKPAGTVTYAEFIKMAVVAATGKDSGAVSGGAHWASGYYKAALDAGMFTEEQIGAEVLDRVIPRKDAALIIANALQDDDADNSDTASKNFSDISGNAYEAQILKSAAKGIITGYEDGTFRPDRTLSRAESSTVISRFTGVLFKSKAAGAEPRIEDYVCTDSGKVLGPYGNVLWQLPINPYTEDYCIPTIIERTGHIYLVYREGGGVMGNDCQIRLTPDKAVELDRNRSIFEYEGISFAAGSWVPPGPNNLFMKKDGDEDWTHIGNPDLLYSWSYYMDENSSKGKPMNIMEYDGGEYLYVLGYDYVKGEGTQAARERTGVYRVNINTNETVRMTPEGQEGTAFRLENGEIVY